MISEAELKQYKEWGLHLVPLQDDTKKPQYKTIRVKQKENGKFKTEFPWKKDPNTGEYITWSDEELLEAKRVGINQEASSLLDVDCDNIEGSPFMSELPETLTIGKKVNGKVVVRKKLYFVNGFHKPKSYKNHNGEMVIERLSHTQSWCFGDNRIILNNVKPTTLNQEQINQLIRTVKKINAWSIMTRYMPNKGGRDSFFFALAGTLIRETDWKNGEAENFVEVLTLNSGDDVQKVRKKIADQREDFESGKNVFGVKELSTLLNVNLPCIDELRPAQDVKEYPLIDGRKFTTIAYPPVNFILRPIFTGRSHNQIYGTYGGGKTIFALACSMAMCSGQDFVGFKSEKKVPTAYLESELPGDDVKDRRNSILQNYLDEKKEFNFDWHFTLTQGDLRMAGFKYGFDLIAVSSNLNNPDAEDYGKRGREYISNWVRRIEKKTGVKPFFFLDNITMLTSFDENRAQDWSPLTKWLIHEKNNGFANCFIHHPNKSTMKGGSSGSNAKERLLDTSIAIEKLDYKHRFEMPGNKNVQCKVSFDKGRNFAGSTWDKEFMLTMTEYGKWKKYPMMDKYDFIIIEGHNRGLSPADMKEEFDDLKLGEKTIYKRLKKLKDLGVIKNEKSNF